jgi:hypothetical protein
VNVKDKNPKEYQAVLSKMNVFKQTLKDCPPPLVLTEGEGPVLTNRQRVESINEAKAKGIQPKSE